MALNTVAPGDFAPIYEWTRQALEKTIDELPDERLRLYVDSTVRELVSRYSPNLPDYLNLQEDDKRFFEEAAGLITALRVRPKLPKSTALGEIAEVKLQQKGFRWALPKAGKPIEQQWLDEALLALGRISYIKAIYRARAANFQPFKVSGPSRHRAELGIHETLMSGVISLITDDWFPEMDQASSGDIK